MTDTAEQTSDIPGDLPDWPRQKVRGHALEGYRYTSKEFADKEWDGIWTRVWLLLGRESEMPGFDVGLGIGQELAVSDSSFEGGGEVGHQIRQGFGGNDYAV